MRTQAIALFHSTFGSAPTQAASAPGRVNLIGDHTDYNGGPVLPVALVQRTTASVAGGESGWLDLVSARDGLRSRVRWDGAVPAGWAGYLVGVMRELVRRHAAPPGARVAVASDLPVGAGLSSSAALTVSTAQALAALGGVTLSARDLVSVAHRAESEHVGVRCGIMDQTIAVYARRGHAVLIECGSGKRRLVPVHARFLVVDTGVRHDLAASAYNARRTECESAVAQLATLDPNTKLLADWPPQRMAELRRLLPQPLRSRALHVVGETARARQAAELLAQGRLRPFGKLVDASHESLRRLFECSAPELDLVVRAARRSGAWGARLTGAGWGGSVLVVIGPESAAGGKREAAIRAAIVRAFERAYGREPVIMAVTPGSGARRERVV